MRRRLHVLAALSCLALLANGPPRSESSEGNGPPPAETEAGASEKQPPAPEGSDLELADVPRFPPPAKEGEPVMRLGGATRGSRSPIQTLVPSTPGYTADPHPVLYWYAVDPIPGSVAFRLARYAEDATVLERTLQGPFEPGVQRIRLAESDVELAPGVLYSWTLETGASSASGGILRVELSPALETELDQAEQGRLPFVYASHGIWYEALDRLSEHIGAEPADPRLRRQRAALLEQVELEAPARADLAVAEASD